MDLFPELRERRIFQIVASVAAAGWIVLEAVNQFVERGVLPDIVYPVALVWYAAGIVASLIAGWYHGEKGAQSVTGSEMGLLSVLLVLAITGSIITVDRLESGPSSALAADGEAGLSVRRVGVLYFEDRTRDDDLRYLADGLTEGLIDELSQVRGLNVLSRNASARVRESDLAPDSVARVLGAGTLVDGTVERDGDRVRVDVRLLDGNSGAEFRRRAFERPADSLLAVQRDVAQEAARFLREWLGEEVELRRRRTGTDDVAAWALVQRAERARKEAVERLGGHDSHGAWAAFDRADSLLARAEDADTLWAEPSIVRAELAYQRARFLLQEPRNADRAVSAGLDHAARALGRDPRSAEARAFRGGLRYVRWLLHVSHDPDEREALLEAARSDLESAVEAEPGLAWVWSALSHLYYQVGDVPAVVLSARRALEEDAFLAAAEEVTWRLFFGSYDLGQFGQARRWCETGAERFPDHYRFAQCRLLLMTVPGAEPDVERGWALVRRIDSLAPAPGRPYQNALGRIVMGGILARAELPDSADAVLRRARVAHDVDPSQELLSVEAAMRLFMDDEEGAMALLKQYVAANPGHDFRRGEGLHWWWTDIADHPEFRQLSGGR